MRERARFAWLVMTVGCAACTHAPGQPLTEARRDDLIIGVEVTGALEAVDSTTIMPPAIQNMWEFKIASLAAEGDDVKTGDPIVSFDPSELTRNLETMSTEADAARKKLEKKRNEAALARRDDALKIAECEAVLRKAKLKTESPDDAITAALQQKLDTLDAQKAELDLASAKNRAEQAKRSDDDEIKRLSDAATYAKSRADAMAANVTRLAVKSPRDGTIVYPAEQRGEKRKVGDSIWMAGEVISVVGLGKMTGSGNVDEVDMARVAVGQSVMLRLDALPDVQLHGHVDTIAKSLAPKSEQDPGKQVHLKVDLDPTNVALRPGMRFRGQVETETLHQVVVVPSEAVFVTLDGPVVYRDHNGRLERVAVVLGRRNATAIEVKSGVAAGDRISRVDPEAL